jgi:hypothetical protein
MAAWSSVKVHGGNAGRPQCGERLPLAMITERRATERQPYL